jgi:hypothetical protein
MDVGMGTGLVFALGLAAGAAGCSNSQTSLLVTVNVVDRSVPFFTEIDFTVSSAADPTHLQSAKLVSAGNATFDGGLPPIPLPYQLLIVVDTSYISDTARVEVDGIDNSSGAVRARGLAEANVVANHQTPVTVTLYGPTSCATDAGLFDAAPSPSCDAADAAGTDGGAGAALPDGG